MRQGRLALLSLFGALALVLAACAPAATPTATPTPPPVVATPTPTPGAATPTPGVATPTATPTAVVEQPQYGGLLLFNTTAPPAYYDCHRTISYSCNQFGGPIFGSLVRYQPGVTTYKPEYLEGDLAERWEVSADGKVYTFYLKRGVKFHDGKPFSAKDVKYSLEKLQDPKKSAFSNEFSVMERVELVDDYTVKVYLKFPSGMFISYLAQGMSNIQAVHLKDVNYRIPAFAVGTGAFKLKSSTTVEYIVEKNPDYHFKGRPYLDGLEIRYMDDAATLNAFIGGKLDVGPASPKDSVEAVKRFAPEARFFYNTAYPVFRGPIFNFTKEGPWQDVRVRKALALVTDFEGAAIAASGGVPEMADSRGGFFWGPELGGVGIPWAEKSKWWWQDRPLAERIAEGKRLMAQAGYPNGFKAQLLVASSSDAYNLPSLLHIDLYKRYLNIDLAFYQPERAVALERREQGNFDLDFEGFVSTLGEAEQSLASIFVPGGASNYGRYSHPVINDILAKMQRELDPAKRIELAHRAERILFDDVPLIPYYKSGNGRSIRPYVKDFDKWHPFYSYLYTMYEIVWFDRNDPTWAKRGK